MPQRVGSIGGRLGYRDDGNTPNTQVALLNTAPFPCCSKSGGCRRICSQRRDWNGSMDTYMGQRIAAIIHCEGGALVVPPARDCWAVDERGRQLSRGRVRRSLRELHHRGPLAERSELNADIIECVRSTICAIWPPSVMHWAHRVRRGCDAGRGDHAAYAEAVDRMVNHLHANAVDVGGRR